MKRYVALPTIAAAAIGSLIVGLCLNGTARAITETIFRYQAPKTGYFQITALAFSPMRNSEFINDGQRISTLEDTNLIGPTCFSAGANFPNGAKLTRLTVWYSKENPPPGSSSVNFTRLKADGGGDLMVSEAFMNSTSGARTAASFAIPAAFQTVNNLAYGYAVVMCLSGLDRLYGMRIAYTYNNAGD